jgi:hypothetical protein
MKLTALLLEIFASSEAKMQDLLKILLSPKKSAWLQKWLRAYKRPDAGPNEITVPPEIQTKAEQTIRDATQWDPTTKQDVDGSYMHYIVNQIAKDTLILPEDGTPLLQSLQTFVKASRRPNWTGHKDVFKYANWRELQKQTIEWQEKQMASGITSESEWIKKAKEGVNKICDIEFETVAGKEPGKYQYAVYEMTTPVGVFVYGRGTRWCTSTSLYTTIKSSELEKTLDLLIGKGTAYETGNYYSIQSDIPGDPWAGRSREEFLQTIKELNGGNLKQNELKVPNSHYRGYLKNAMHYLKSGPLYTVFRNGKPYIQLNSEANQIMDTGDAPLRVTSPGLAIIFRAMVQTGKLSERLGSSLAKKVESSGLKQLEEKGKVPSIKVNNA